MCHSGLAIQIADQGRQSVQRLGIEAKHLSNFARCQPSTVSNDIRGHGSAELAISLIDILNRLLAVIA